MRDGLVWESKEHSCRNVPISRIDRKRKWGIPLLSVGPTSAGRVRYNTAARRRPLCAACTISPGRGPVKSLLVLFLFAPSVLPAQSRFDGTWEMKMDTLMFSYNALEHLLG